MTRFNKRLLSLTMATALLSGCSSNSTTGTSTGAETSSNLGAASTSNSSGEKLQIITSTFPEYDWTKQLLGDNIDNVDLVLLLDSGVDLHSYAPTVDDIISIGSADLFIHNGGESVALWVDDVLSQATNADLITINLLEELGSATLAAEHFHYDDSEECTDEDCDHDHSTDTTVAAHDHSEEECTDPDCDHDHSADTTEEAHVHDEDCEEDCCAEEEHDHDHSAEAVAETHDHSEEECTDEDCDHDHSAEAVAETHDHSEEECTDEDCHHDHSTDDSHSSGHEDEHFWMSFANAKTSCTEIATQLQVIDPDNAEMYATNLENYLAELDALDTAYADMVNSASKNVMLVADRFPYVYLTADYGIEYYAAFSGCSAETEASFATIVFLAEKVDELGLDYVVTTETGNDIADTVISSTSDKDQEAIVIDSLQSATSKSGETYLSIMENNLEALTTILG